MYRSVAHLIALATLMVSPLEAQRISSYRGGVTVAARDTLRALPTLFAPPTAARFAVSAEYIGFTAGLGAAAGAVSFSDRDCSDCARIGAMLGSYVGTGVGNRLAADALRCDRWNASVRTGFASFLVSSIALMVGRSNGAAGEWTATLGVPLATAYSVAGCTPR